MKQKLKTEEGVRIYGYADDMVCVDGCICYEYESFVLSKKGIPIIISDGTSGVIKYDKDGIWRFYLKTRGEAIEDILPSVGDEGTHIGKAVGCTPYSEVLILKDGLYWINIG